MFTTKLLAVACIAAGVLFGALWYVAHVAADGRSEMHPLDAQFYLGLYVAIGAVSGLLAWLLAWFVERGRLRPTAAAKLTLFPAAILLLLVVDKNVLTAVAFVTLVVTGAIPTLVVLRLRRVQQRG